VSESLYVYYRVRAGAEPVVRAAASQLQEALRPFCAETGLQHRSDDPLTWMEIYRDIRDRSAFMAAMQNLTDVTLWCDTLEANRHGQTRVDEWFRDLPSL